MLHLLKASSLYVQFLGWLIATAVTCVVFIYSNFETKESSNLKNQTQEKSLDKIDRRLDGIEARLDRVLEKLRH